MAEHMNQTTKEALFQYLLRVGDDLLILGHRLSEWCGHAPILEEDVALANIALDCIGQAEALLGLAGEVEGEGRDADRLAYHRDEYEFCNVRLVELPKGDFGFTIMRQFLYDAYALLFFEQAKSSAFKPFADIAAKAHKEVLYHLRHSRAWVHRLGDGTEESNRRVQTALDELWTCTGELFEADDVDRVLANEGIAVDLEKLKQGWKAMVVKELETATLTVPSDEQHMVGGSRKGRHSEFLGHLLAEMQILARSHPDAAW